MDCAFGKFRQEHVPSEQGVPRKLQREGQQRAEKAASPPAWEAKRLDERRVRKCRAERSQQKEGYLEEVHGLVLLCYFTRQRPGPDAWGFGSVEGTDGAFAVEQRGGVAVYAYLRAA